ncbi:hypothetical protein pb186bvf_010601 [Paramecium bursaria]
MAFIKKTLFQLQENIKSLRKVKMANFQQEYTYNKKQQNNITEKVGRSLIYNCYYKFKYCMHKNCQIKKQQKLRRHKNLIIFILNKTLQKTLY